MAEVPALQIADFGADVPEALEHPQAMAISHLDCLPDPEIVLYNLAEPR